jgi:hypothetical protein
MVGLEQDYINVFFFLCYASWLLFLFFHLDCGGWRVISLCLTKDIKFIFSKCFSFSCSVTLLISGRLSRLGKRCGKV